jgi:ABC-2 type transport system permease protein
MSTDTALREHSEGEGPAESGTIRARRAGLMTDIRSIGLRGLRAAWRDPESVIPPIFVGAFFFAINVGSLQSLAEGVDPGFDYKAFQLSTAIVLTVTGITRAYGLTLDIQNGYFDKLALSPVRRPALLLGHMIADFCLAVGLALAVSLVAMAVGVRFDTGPVGFLAYLALAGIWSVAYAGVPYALALKTPSSRAHSYPRTRCPAGSQRSPSSTRSPTCCAACARWCPARGTSCRSPRD